MDRVVVGCANVVIFRQWRSESFQRNQQEIGFFGAANGTDLKDEFAFVLVQLQLKGALVRESSWFEDIVFDQIKNRDLLVLLRLGGEVRMKNVPQFDDGEFVGHD